MANNSVKRVKLPPTLIIGLGGTGCDIVSRVDKLANEAQREFIRCVYFDTDANELRIRKEEAPHTFTVQTSKAMTVGQALRTDREARDNSFPASSQLLKKPLTEGAGQVRAVSKLAFDTTIRDGRIKPLHDAINELQYLDGDTLEQSMRVVIVTTLVGGTGSGILLPVSMYLRDYLENICQTKPLIRGFCVLPDVFFHGSNKTETEKNNLRVNAYAALRELDAFMRKADNPDGFTKFSLLMPTPGTSDEYDDYAENPMDFCFLYDGLNMDGNSLHNLEAYKRHVSECIFASSVSMLNKRLNSSEDNTILSRCGEGGRNRYCGIGSARMVYPFEQIRDYIAMGWMSQAMTDEWLRYDKEYEKQMAQRQASKRRGVVLPPIDKRDFYCNIVESDHNEENYFATAIYSQCHESDADGIGYGAPKWVSYYKSLLDYISDTVDSDADYDEGAANKIRFCISAITESANQNDEDSVKSNFRDLALALKKYYTKTKRRAESKASIIADSLFAPDNFNISSEHHIEYWLAENGVFMHPNAIRYFLYSLERMFNASLEKLKSNGMITPEVPNGDGEYISKPSFTMLEEKVKDFFEGKRYAPYVSKKDKGDDSAAGMVTIEEFVNSWDRRKLIDFDGGMDKADWESAVSRVTRECDTHFKNIKRYYKTYLEVTILKKALEYINSLCSSYEYFFLQLDSEIKRLPRRMERITQSFKNNMGDPTMYVCASEECILTLSEQCPNIVESIDLTDDFKGALFDSIYGVLRFGNPDKQKKIIDDLVSHSIIEFWRDQVVKQYRGKVDMDIIDALRTQAEIEDGKFDVKEQLYYIKGKREEAMKLAAPFIDSPIGEEPYIIEAYSLSGEVSSSDDLQKNAIINDVFSGYECDPLMDKYQMLFMKAMYNLRISDLPKFAPADDMWVDPHDDGSYFKQYWNRINKVIPDDKLTKSLTPHLDKRWHYIGVMPDLSEKSEERCLRDAQIAFFICLAYGRIKYDRNQYRFIDKNGDYISEKIVVGDGMCNRFSEIYEAMLMSRPLVGDQLKYYESKFRNEKEAGSFCKIDHTSTELYQLLRGASVKIGGVDIEELSFLELPILFKATAVGKRRSDDECVLMVRNMMDFIEDYLAEFYEDKLKCTQCFVKWMTEQAVLMCKNLKEIYDGRIIASPFEDSLVSRIKSVLESRINDCRMSCAADDKSVDEFFEQFSAAFNNA